MCGSIETLTQNIVKVTNPRDKNRIRNKIQAMKDEIKAEKQAERAAKAQAKGRIRMKCWKYDYMIKKKQIKLRECLGLPVEG